ncbi:MAG: TolC family protein, partial [Planctomycetes bacterium]|nr:TolC family protein [Planctomycetota bacterium]
QAAAAQSKLNYLLGLDPCAQLVPVDPSLMPFDLIDATPPACQLVSQALATGPGVQELQGLLALIQESMERAQGPAKYLPVFQVGMAEGLFGASAGDDTNWDNRFDLGLQARWNLTEFLTARSRRRVAESKAQQAQLAYQELRAKLTAGVQEAREAILSGHDQIRQAEQQVDFAQQAYKLSNQRLKSNVAGSTPTEVLLAIQSLGRAQLNYLTTTNAFDKAQLRLMVLLGPGAVIKCRPPEPLPGGEK